MEPNRANMVYNFLLAGSLLGICGFANWCSGRKLIPSFRIAFVTLIVVFVYRVYPAFEHSEHPRFRYYMGYETASVFWPLLVVFFWSMLNLYYNKRVTAEQALRLSEQRESDTKLQAERDKTLAAQREAALKLEAQKLEHLAEIGTMASGLNHELGNIITPFKLEIGELAARTTGDADFKESIGILTRSVASAERLAEGLRNVSKPIHLKIAKVDLSSLLDDVIANIKLLPSAENVRFEAIVSPDAATCDGDEEWLTRVLYNLVKNACEAMQSRPERKVTLSTAKYDWAVRIEVSDNGPGMTEHTLKELFRPFFTTKGSLGTGLGLYMSRKVLNAHGGKLEVKSASEKGTTFSVLIPLKPADKPA